MYLINIYSVLVRVTFYTNNGMITLLYKKIDYVNKLLGTYKLQK